jgi:hypothetical protein
LEASLFFWCSYLTSDGWSTAKRGGERKMEERVAS